MASKYIAVVNGVSLSDDTKLPYASQATIKDITGLGTGSDPIFNKGKPKIDASNNRHYTEIEQIQRTFTFEVINSNTDVPHYYNSVFLPAMVRVGKTGYFQFRGKDIDTNKIVTIRLINPSDSMGSSRTWLGDTVDITLTCDEFIYTVE